MLCGNVLCLFKAVPVLAENHGAVLGKIVENKSGRLVGEGHIFVDVAKLQTVSDAVGIPRQSGFRGVGAFSPQ